jgi:hypothetical protein
MALAMEGRELDHHFLGELGLTAHENPFPWYKNIIEDEGRAVLGIVRITDVTTIEFAHVEGRSSHYVD